MARNNPITTKPRAGCSRLLYVFTLYFFASRELARTWKTSLGWAGSLVFTEISKWCLPPIPACIAYGKTKLVLPPGLMTAEPTVS